MISLHLLGALLSGEKEITVGLKVEVGHFDVVDVQRPLGLAQKICAEQGHLNILFQRELLPDARDRQRRRTRPILKDTQGGLTFSAVKGTHGETTVKESLLWGLSRRLKY